MEEKKTEGTSSSQEAYQNCRKEWMSGAGGSISVRAVFWMLDALNKGYGKNFQISGALNALDALADTAQRVKNDLSQRTQGSQGF